MELILPVVTALIGVLGGLLISYFNNKKNERAEKSKLALEIVKVELDRATKRGFNFASTHSTLAHWAVVSELIRKYSVDLDDPLIKNKIEEITDRYREYCFVQKEQDLVEILKGHDDDI